jgi:hypothetical protein
MPFDCTACICCNCKYVMGSIPGGIIPSGVNCFP